MKRVIITSIKVLIILIIVAWISIIFVDYFKAKDDKAPKFCISEETKTYDDGTVYICTGIGYKVINYNRKSISAVEFGPFFIKERNS